MTDWRAILRKLSPHADPQIVAMIADHADEQFEGWDISSIRRQATVIAHAHVETKGFTRLEENLNYTAKRLREVWSNRFPTIESAAPFANHPRKLAERVYGGREGNRPGTDDAWTYRGKGLWHCTFRRNTEALAKALGVTPEVAASWLTDPAHALECACALFHILGVAPSADSGDVAAQTGKINGGGRAVAIKRAAQNGLADREAAFRTVLRLLAAEASTARAETQDAGNEPAATLQDLRAAGSRTIAGADRTKGGLGGLVTAAGGAAAVGSQIQDVAGQLQTAAESLSSAAGVLAWAHANWKVIALIALLVLAAHFAAAIWRGASLVQRARVDDANTGVHVGR